MQANYRCLLRYCYQLRHEYEIRLPEHYFEGSSRADTVGTRRLGLAICRIEPIYGRRRVNMATVEAHLTLHPGIVVLLSEERRVVRRFAARSRSCMDASRSGPHLKKTQIVARRL
jgi:hypothetical protein